MADERSMNKCVICGRGSKVRVKIENERISVIQDEIYSLWKRDCSETLCEILFGTGTQSGKSYVPCFEDLCSSCEQLARDAHFTYKQFHAFQKILTNLANLLRRRIHSNFWRINKDKTENDSTTDLFIDDYDPLNKYTHQQLNHIFFTLASRCESTFGNMEDAFSKNGRFQLKSEPAEVEVVEPEDNDFWNSPSEEFAAPKRHKRKRRKLKCKVEKREEEEESEDMNGEDDMDSEWQVEKSITGKRKRGRPRKAERGSEYTVKTHKSKRTVNCTFENCTFKFTSEEKMQAHVRGFHEGVEKPHLCSICSKGFSRRKMMMHHVRVVHKKRKSPYSHFCKFCRKGYIEEEELNAHYAVAHLDPTNPFQCAFCPEVYSNSIDLKHHMKKVHPDPEDLLKPQCKVCGKFFSNQNNLMVHSRLHGDPDQIPKCEVCQRIFSNKGSLKKHTNRYHSEEVRYTCETCGKGFKYLPDLNDHSKKRHNEMLKKYACKICDKRFSTSGKCKLHEVTHTGIKEHVCDLCGKAFAFKGNLTVHQKLHTREGDTPVRTRKKKESISSVTPIQPTNSFYDNCNWTNNFRFNPPIQSIGDIL